MGGGSDTSTIRKAPFPFFWKSRKYDPRNVKRYLGWEFETHYDSVFGVAEDESFYGHPSTEGAKIDLIGGVKPEIIKRSGLSEERKRISKKNWDKLIMDNAEEVKEGLQLVVSFTSEYANRKGHPGMYSSVIRKIRKGKGDKKQDN